MADPSQAPDPDIAEGPAPADRDGSRSAALTILYDAHWAELVRYVRRTFGIGPPDPEDVVQSAFAHFAALAHPQMIDNPRAFLYRASRNFVIDQRRRAMVRTRATQRGDLSQLSETSDELDPERVLAGKDRLRVLDSTIRGMPVKLRDALILHRIEELSYVEIARRLNISQTMAKRQVSQALLICARALRAEEGEQ